MTVKSIRDYINLIENIQNQSTEPDAYGNTGEKHECGSCDGTGIDQHDEVCPVCGGKGWVRDKQGVTEGTVYPNAEVIKSKNGKPVGEIYQDGNTWGAFHYKADYGADGMASRDDAIEELKFIHNEHRQQGVAEGSLNESDKFTSWYDWKDQAKSSGYTIAKKDDKIVALNKQGQVVGHWSDVGKFLSGKAPRPNFKRPEKQGVGEEQLDETTPEAIKKINELTRN